MACGADTEANTLLTALTAGKNFDLPDVDLNGDQFKIPAEGSTGAFAPVSRLTNDDLTTGTIDGSGTFDALMRGFKAHLTIEYEKGRITGADFTKAYTALVEGAMSNATQFLLGRDQAYWQAVAAQLQARLAEIGVVTARVQLETAKAQLKAIYYQSLTAEAEYGLTKMKISSESMAYCSAKYQLEVMLPQQLKLLIEQTESQRAQTLNARTDGAAITGLLGKQKDLYSQQITSYKRDGEIKAAKLFTDAWITMKTIDEGLEPPVNFANDSLNRILRDVKSLNEIGG